MRIRQDKLGIGNNIKKLRLKAGFSQSQLVVELQLLGIDISCDVYKKIEQNRYNIRVCELVALKQIFNVSYDEFFMELDLGHLS